MGEIISRFCNYFFVNEEEQRKISIDKIINNFYSHLTENEKLHYTSLNRRQDNNGFIL